MIKRLLLLSCLLVALSGQVGYCSEATYQITEMELSSLEMILNESETSNNLTLTEWKQSKNDLMIARTELAKYRQELEEQKKELQMLRVELAVARNGSQEATNELEKVNQSLQKYAQEVKHTEKRLKVQRNIFAVIAAAGLIVAVA